MDCRTARLLLEFRGRELGDDDAGLLEAHLADCAECGLVAREERRADDHLAAAVRAVAVPANLRERLRAGLIAERGMRTPGRRLRFAGWAAAAAALLVAVCAWWLTRPLPNPSLADIHAEPVPRSAADAEQRFRVAAPPDFNYGLLAACNIAEFEGRRVPHLFFVRGDAVAEVFLLSARHFDRDAMLAQGRVDSGGFTVEVRAHPSNAQVFYLVKYTGGSLAPFLTKAGPTT